MRVEKTLVAVAMVGLILALVGCAGSGSTGGGYTTPTTSGSSGGTTGTSSTTVAEQNFAFSPSTLTVKVGDTVTFTNKDSASHNVKIDGQELGAQNQGESKTWTATKAGSFPFSCITHPSMTGQITVQ